MTHYKENKIISIPTSVLTDGFNLQCSYSPLKAVDYTDFTQVAAVAGLQTPSGWSADIKQQTSIWLLHKIIYFLSNGHTNWGRGSKVTLTYLSRQICSDFIYSPSSRSAGSMYSNSLTE